MVTDCTTGNCLTEIVTTIRVNLDLDCDGEVDSHFPTDPRTGEPEMLCFFAEARTPTLDRQAGLPAWSNPLQARISTVGGDKTVNFAVDQPTAVELAAFEATPQGNGVMLAWETASELDNLGFTIYRAESQAGQLVKINQHLIASQNPGSAVGADYSFLDEVGSPGRHVLLLAGGYRRVGYGDQAWSGGSQESRCEGSAGTTAPCAHARQRFLGSWIWLLEGLS